MATRTDEERFEEMIEEFDPEIGSRFRSSVAKLRSLLPPATEMVYDNTYALVIGFCPSERPSEAVFSLVASTKSVALCFLQAFRMPGFEAEPLFTGSGNVVRHTRLLSADDLDSSEVRRLIGLAMETAIVPFDPDARRRLEIRAVAPKKRPRRAMGK